MKKITTILMLLMLTCMGAQAQTDDSWPINFDKSLRSTHASRYTDFVGLDDQKITIPGAAVGGLIYNDLTSESLTVAAGATVTPTFGYRGWAMYGYLYIDYNNDGDFTDDGELVSQLPGNNWASGSTADKTIPAFTVSNTEGTYRARFKVEWNNTDPGGNPNGSIAENGGCMVDVMITVIATTAEQNAAYEKVQSWLPLLQNQALVTDASNYLSNAKQGDEGSYAALLDKNNSTYFHSQWSGAMVNVPGHDLQARLPEAVDAFHLFYVTRSTGTGYPTGFRIDGSNNADDFSEAGGSSWTEDVASVTENLPAGATKSYMSDVISMSNSYQYLRFVPTIGNNQGKNWFCLAEFWLFPSNETVDAAIEMMKNVNSVFDITNDMVATINQIDADLRSTTVNVTYNLVVDGTTVESKVVTQAKNSAVSIPVDLTSGYYAPAYDFTTSGTIGSIDCTITVTATPKEGVVTDLANLSNEKVYTLTSRRGTLSTDATKLTTNTTGADFKNFAIITYDDKKFIWSESDSKWVKKDGTFTDQVADIAESSQMVLTIEGVRNGVKPLYFGGIGDYGINTNAGGHVAMNTWTTRDDGNEFVVKENGDFDPTNLISALDAYFNPSYTINYIVKDEAGETLFTANDVPTTEGATITTLPEAYQRSLFYTYNTVDVTITESVTTIEFTATPKEDAPFEFTADTSAPVWYNLAFTSTPNYVTYVADGAQNVQLPTTLAEDETTQWAFIGNPYDGFQLVNNAAGTDLVLGSGTTTGSDNTGGNTYATLQSKGSQVNEVWTAKASTSISGKNGFFLFNTENHALNKRNGTANISYWTGGYDSGSTFVATKVLSDEEKYNELIALLESYPFGTGTNQYNLTLEGADQTENAKNLLQNLKDAGYSEDNKAELDKIVAGMSLNMPKAGFYRIKGQNSGMYLAAGLAENNKFAMTDAVDATTIFCFDGTKLINYSDGMVNGMSASAWAWVYGDGAASEVTFQDGLTKGGYGIKSSTANFYDNGDGSASADRGGNVTINENTNSRYTSWYLEEVPELPVTLSLADDGKYYAVFSAPVAASEVIGASVNGVTVSGNQAVYKEVTGGIPADKGVLLIGDSDEAIVILGEYTGDEIESDLTPITAAESSSTALFLDPESTDPFGFYELDGATGGFTASAPNDGENTVLELVNSNTTGIENIENGAFENGAVYNLQGQKVNKAQKGVFIQNGKKVVLK